MSVHYYYYEPIFSISDFYRLIDDAVTSRPNSGSGGNSENAQRRQIDNTVSGPSGGVFQPRIDVQESSKENTVTATFELPGMKKEDVAIDVHNNRLSISGEFKHANEAEKDGYIVRERHSGKFSRTLPLPSGTKTEEIKAAMENGVLTVTFPKTSPEQTAKRINIS